MGVDDNAWLTEGISKNDIRGFSTHARQGDQFLQRLRDLFIEAFGHGLAAGNEMFGLILKETGRTNELFDFR